MRKMKNILLWVLAVFLLSGSIVSGIGIGGPIKGVVIAIFFIAGVILAPAQEKENNPTPPPIKTPPITVQTETPTVEPTPNYTPSPTTKPTPEPTPESTPLPTEIVETEPPEQMVWISNSGSRYHRRSTCSGMEDPWQVTISEAQSMGLTACGRCW